jgi:hypothetical protein
VIWTQIKKIGESIKNNDFQILNKNINYVISELAILGIEYKFVLTNQMKKNIKIWRDSINTKQYNISDKYRNLIDCEIKERNTFLK